MTRFLTTLATIWHLALPYFRSEDRWPGRLLLGAIVSMELAVVGLSVLINQWNARFYNALQDRNWDNFVSELLFFCMLAAIYIVVRVYQLYLNQWLQIRWRRWMTQRYVGQWLDGANHYRMQMLGDAADNPDQRIAEDIRQFIDGSNGVGILPIGLGLLNAIVTLVSFVIILWGLSQAAPLTVYGWTIPGYLVWAALGYAAAGTLFTHLIGRPLIKLNFDQQRYEADFRFNLVRVRENSEQIALLHGETAERGRLMDRFHAVMDNWLSIMTRQKRLTFLTASYGQASVVFPIIVVKSGLFRRPHPARRADPDRIRLQQRAGRTLVLRRQLCAHRRMARRDRAARRLQRLDRERSRVYNARAEHRGHCGARARRCA